VQPNKQQAVANQIACLTIDGSCNAPSVLQDLLMQYLGMQLQFDVADTARLLFIVALCGLAIKLGLMAALVRRLGEQGVLVLGLAAYTAQVTGRGGGV
jgi:hypothetical protein